MKKQVEWPEYNQLVEKYTKMEIENPFAGFSIDLAPVQSQVAAVNQAYNENVKPLFFGLVNDVDSAYSVALERLKAAGFEEVKAEVQKQLNAYIAANGIK